MSDNLGTVTVFPRIADKLNGELPDLDRGELLDLEAHLRKQSDNEMLLAIVHNLKRDLIERNNIIAEQSRRIWALETELERSVAWYKAKLIEFCRHIVMRARG